MPKCHNTVSHILNCVNSIDLRSRVFERNFFFNFFCCLLEEESGVIGRQREERGKRDLVCLFTPQTPEVAT